MYSKFFTVEAALVWNGLPAARREALTEKTVCRKCKLVAPIGNLRGSMKNGDLVLKGECCFCFTSVTIRVKATELTMPAN